MVGSVIYLDNAATTWPKPESVYLAMDDFMRTKAANPGRTSNRMSVEAASVIQDTRFRLCRLLNGADPSRVIFTLNATDALNLALKGILRPGDNVICTTMEHNSIRRPLRTLAECGVTSTKVLCARSGIVDPGDIERAILPNTRMIAVCHASNVTGSIQPILAIGEIARRRGILFLLDAAQSAGVLPIDVEAVGVDLVAFPGHKGLFGPPGTGGLYVGRSIGIEDLLTLREGGTGGNSDEETQPASFPGRYEAGTLNTVGIAGLGAGLKFIEATGLEQIAGHERELADALIDGLSSVPGVSVYGPANPADRVAVVSFNVEGWEPGDLGMVLDESFGIACRTGLHCAPDAIRTIGAPPAGTVRLSPGYFNTMDQIERCVQAVEQVAASASA